MLLCKLWNISETYEKIWWMISKLSLFLSLSDRQGRSQNGSLIGHVTSPAQEMVVGPERETLSWIVIKLGLFFLQNQFKWVVAMRTISFSFWKRIFSYFLISILKWQEKLFCVGFSRVMNRVKQSTFQLFESKSLLAFFFHLWKKPTNQSFLQIIFTPI